MIYNGLKIALKGTPATVQVKRLRCRTRIFAPYLQHIHARPCVARLSVSVAEGLQGKREIWSATHTYVNTYIHTHIYRFTHTYAHTHTQTRTRTCTSTCTHIHMHSHLPFVIIVVASQLRVPALSTRKGLRVFIACWAALILLDFPAR